jgi:hypothetical protein
MVNTINSQNKKQTSFWNVPFKVLVSFTQFLHLASLRLNSPFVPVKSKLFKGAMVESLFERVVNKLVVDCMKRDILIEDNLSQNTLSKFDAWKS